MHIDELKQMYRKYKKMGHPKAAARTLERLRELDVPDYEILNLRLED